MRGRLLAGVVTDRWKAYDGKFDMIQTVAGVTPEYPFVVSDRAVHRLMAGPAPANVPAPGSPGAADHFARFMSVITLQNHINNWSVAEPDLERHAAV